MARYDSTLSEGYQLTLHSDDTGRIANYGHDLERALAEIKTLSVMLPEDRYFIILGRSVIAIYAAGREVFEPLT